MNRNLRPALRPVRSGFALRDLVTAVATLGILLALAATGLPRVRSGALLSECVDNQREMSAGSAAFALANQEVFAGLTWLRGDQSSQYPDLRTQAAVSNLGAHAAQVVDILRRGGRTDIPAINNWFSDSLYSAVPLGDFLGKALTDPFTVCPADSRRLAWRLNPSGFDAGAFLPFQPPPSSTNKRWPYSSSYAFSIASMDPWQSEFSTTLVSFRLVSNGTHTGFSTSNSNPYGPSALSRVAFPSRKVYFFDSADWHFSTVAVYHSLTTRSLPATFFDGSVRIVHPKQANRPWYPTFPAVSNVVAYSYAPSVWEPTGGMPAGTPPPPLGQVTAFDPFRYTRDGLLGWDFPEMSRAINATTTAQSGPP